MKHNNQQQCLQENSQKGKTYQHSQRIFQSFLNDQIVFYLLGE